MDRSCRLRPRPRPDLPRGALATTLRLPVRFIAGTPIEAHVVFDFGTGPGGSARAEGEARLLVSGLPAGVQAIACPGSDITPVRRATWGMLKTLMR